jgi:hypothetical protein
MVLDRARAGRPDVKPSIAKPLSLSVPILKAAGGGVVYVAVHSIVALSDLWPFVCPPGALACVVKFRKTHRDRSAGAGHSQRQILAGP